MKPHNILLVVEKNALSDDAVLSFLCVSSSSGDKTVPVACLRVRRLPPETGCEGIQRLPPCEAPETKKKKNKPLVYRVILCYI